MADAPPLYYFAYGSMTNPASLRSRKLHPLRSFPAEVLDFSLCFDLGRAGYADARPAAGASFHGVLHLMPAAQLSELDGFEVGYKRTPARVRCYAGLLFDAVVYSAPRDASGAPLSFSGAAPVAPLPPSQRYVDLIVAGCRHFGVAESHCEWLLAMRTTPRTAPEHFQVVPLLDGLPSWDEAALAAAPLSADSVTTALNGKVLRVSGPASIFLRNIGAHGSHTEVPVAKSLFDVKYGAPDAVQDFTREHSAYVEDQLICDLFTAPGTAVAVLARIPQIYRAPESRGAGALAE